MIQSTGNLLFITGKIEVMGQELTTKNGYRFRYVDVRADDGRVFQFKFFGRNIPENMDSFERGDDVEVQFDISQRPKSNADGCWTDLDGKYITKLPQGTDASAPQATEAGNAEMPF